MTPSEGGLADKWRLLQVILADGHLSRVDVQVAGVILDLYWHKRGCAWPGYAYLSQLTGRPRRTVIRSVAALERHGYLTVERRQGGGRGKVNAYVPAFERVDQEIAETVTAMTPFTEPAGHPDGPGPGSKKGDGGDTVFDSARCGTVATAPKSDGTDTVSVENVGAGAGLATERVTGEAQKGDKMDPKRVSQPSPETIKSKLISKTRAPARGRRSQRPGPRPDPKQPEMLLPIAGGQDAGQDASQAGGQPQSAGLSEQVARELQRELRATPPPECAQAARPKPLTFAQVAAKLGKAGLRQEEAIGALCRLDSAGFGQLAALGLGCTPGAALAALHRVLVKDRDRRAA